MLKENTIPLRKLIGLKPVFTPVTLFNIKESIIIKLLLIPLKLHINELF